MPTYIALTYTAEVDWRQPEFADGLKEYAAFQEAHAAVLRGGHALYPTATAATVRVPDGRGGAPIVSRSATAASELSVVRLYSCAVFAFATN